MASSSQPSSSSISSEASISLSPTQTLAPRSVEAVASYDANESSMQSMTSSETVSKLTSNEEDPRPNDEVIEGSLHQDDRIGSTTSSRSREENTHENNLGEDTDAVSLIGSSLSSVEGSEQANDIKPNESQIEGLQSSKNDSLLNEKPAIGNLSNSFNKSLRESSANVSKNLDNHTSPKVSTTEEVGRALLISTNDIEEGGGALVNTSDDVDGKSYALNSTDNLEGGDGALSNSTEDVEDFVGTLLNSTNDGEEGDLSEFNRSLSSSSEGADEITGVDDITGPEANDLLDSENALTSTETIADSNLSNTEESSTATLGDEAVVGEGDGDAFINSTDDEANDSLNSENAINSTETVEDTNISNTEDSTAAIPGEEEIVEGAYQRQPQHFQQQAHKPQRPNQMSNLPTGQRFGNKNFEDLRDLERGPMDARFDQRQHRPMPPSAALNPLNVDNEIPEATSPKQTLLKDESSLAPPSNVTSFTVADDATSIIDAETDDEDAIIALEDNITSRSSPLVNNDSMTVNRSSEIASTPSNAIPTRASVASASSQSKSIPSLTPSVAETSTPTTGAQTPSSELLPAKLPTTTLLPTVTSSPTATASPTSTRPPTSALSQSGSESSSGAKSPKPLSLVDSPPDSCSLQLENCRRTMHTVRATRSALFAWKSLFSHAIMTLSKQVASSYPQLVPANLSTVEILTQFTDGLSVPIEIADELLQLFITDTNESSTDSIAPPALRSFVIMLRQLSSEARMNALAYLESQERTEIVREHSRDALDSVLSFTLLMVVMAVFSRLSSFMISCCCCRCFCRSSKSTSGTISTKPLSVSQFAPPSPPGPPLLHASRGGGVDGMKQVVLLPPEGVLPAATLEKLKAAGMTGSKPIGTARREQMSNPPFASPPPPFARPPQHLDFSAEPPQLPQPPPPQQPQQHALQQTAPLTQIATQSVSDVPKPLFVASSAPAALSTPKNNVRKLNSSQPVMPLHGQPSSTR